jgi:hypothetical protein
VVVNISSVNCDGLGTFAGYLYKQFSISIGLELRTCVRPGE